MADLFRGQTMSKRFDFISGGAEYTFTFPWQPDKVVFANLTDWTATAAGLPVSVWYRGLTTAGYAYQEQVINTAAAESYNFLQATTNGFTVADTSGGSTSSHCTISAITQADPCVITHSTFSFQDDQVIRITDLGPVGDATDRGMDELNNNRYRIVVVDSTHISLKDVITGEAIDSTSFVAYVSGGRITLETHSKALNYPQVTPYASTPYVSNPFKYDPILYKLTAGTSVMGTDGDVFVIEAFKFGEVESLGDIG